MVNFSLKDTALRLAHFPGHRGPSREQVGMAGTIGILILAMGKRFWQTVGASHSSPWPSLPIAQREIECRRYGRFGVDLDKRIDFERMAE
jgi:hypothetical protein